MSRETVMLAVFAKIQTLAGFNTFSRQLRLFSDVPPDQQPSIMMPEHLERRQPRPKGLPNKLTMGASLVIYFIPQIDATGARNGSSLMNGYLDQLDVLFAPDNPLTTVCSLGGIVDHAWIEGDVLKDPGDIDGQGMIVAPFRILVP